MLEGQLEAGKPKEGTHPEDPCPGAGAAMEKTAAAAEVPREDGNAGEMPSLQQQITRLHQELRRQESLWADVHRKLQSHIDVLRKQNLELREELRSLQRQQWEARKKPAASPHAGREPHTLALQPASGKISLLSADEETMPKHAGRKSQSATLLGQRSSPNNLAPPKPMSLKTEGINSGKTPPQEDREKSPPGRHQDRSPAPTGRPTPGAERRGVSEDGKVMHPSSRSPQNSSGRKSPVQASQAATLQEQMAAAGGADGSSSVSENSEGGFLSHVQPDELAGSSPNIAERQEIRAVNLCIM
ncbi:T-complex protein 10A homolog isoform X1 [Nomascus leucogenys]|uniref:T-complex protein 10A homolog isoform X1 n=1 Tax=Nomascus leucogenys TaxID=61853 RepID=UPI00122D7426|nr:T-complex protein 10A homolog isoform X1 [Nomascus leucogenys]